ncbi:MAG TPA: 6,7-dimethyl-8-ribityllumazine synthase, partial [Caulobacter sp.]|nr:6,7-dimethyl-8-ribityllumazine synthase [Caulobacter sp.]
GVLTVDEEDQAWTRAKVSEGDRGGAAAKACLETVALKRQLLGQTR